MATLREARVPLNDDGSVDYNALQADQRAQDFNTRMRDLTERDRAEDPMVAIVDRYAKERGIRQEEFDRKWGPEATNFDLGALGSMEPVGTPVHYATNRPDVAAKWIGEGKAPTMVAETPQALGEAATGGVKDIRKSVDYKEGIPAQPSLTQIKSMDEFNKFWNPIAAKEFPNGDPMRLNPEVEGEKVAADVMRKYASGLSDPTDPHFALYKKEVESARKNVVDSVKYQQVLYKDLRSESMKFFNSDEARAEAERVRQDNRRIAADKAAADKRPTLYQAQMETNRVFSTPAAYYLTNDEKSEIEGGKSADIQLALQYKRLRPDVLTQLNAQRVSAGLPELVEQTKVKGNTTFYYYPPAAKAAGPTAKGGTISTPPLTREAAIAELKRRGKL